MPEYLWRTADYEGVEVLLARRVWDDKILHAALGHPEVRDYLEEARITVHAPEAVFSSVRDIRSRLFYRSGLTTGNFIGHWLVVVVKYVKEPHGLRGYVSTAFISRDLKRRGEKLWPKSAS